MSGIWLFVTGEALSQNWHWTGLANDGLWRSGANWDNGNTVPPSTAATVNLDAANGWSVITILPGEVENCTTSDANPQTYGMIYGPEYGAGLNVYGTLNWDWYLAPVQNDPTRPSVVNLYSGASVSGEGIALGDTWWYSGGPYVTMNIYSNAFAGINFLYWGGHLNLYGGVLSITNGIAEQTMDAVSDATRSMNLAGGKLILPDAFSDTVGDWISRGILLAYGKAQDTNEIVIDQSTMPGRTVVTATPLGGSLIRIHLQPLPTNMMVDTMQNLTVLGDYPNVQNVVLAALNPAMLPGPVVYHTSAPGVATIDTNGVVTAVGVGSVVLSAAAGSYSSTNSATIVVVPSTNSAPRLPEEQPVLGYNYAHDPSRIIKGDGGYYMFGDGQGINASYSPDLRNWSAAAPVFPGNPPAWTTNAVPGFTGYFWAPDIIYLNGQYYLYYAASQWGTITSAIGLVTTPSLSAPVWTDQGSVIQYQSGVSYNCIDPSMLLDTNNGTLWLSFGSYSDGIFVTQLDPVTGKRITPNSTLTKVADTSTSFFSNTSEGSYLCQRGAYYYLFVNWGGCCSGISSTYNIRVGRSASVTGPYLDRNGVSMLTGGGSLFLESTGRFIGPGHAAVLNENGTNWFTYHYYDGNNSGSATFTIGLLNWSADGWPVFTNDWSAFYPFNVDAREHLGLYNGAMQNGAAITNEPGVGNVLALNGVSQYALLPDPVANASTFCAWVKWNGGQNWQRIFDFGDSTGSYLFLTPSANNGVMRFAITTSGNNNEQRIDAPAALPTNSWCHVAVTLDGSTGLLYLNGLPVATNSALTIRPWQTLARSNYVGKSQFPGDPGYNGEISSLRIFGRALGPGEIRDMAYANPKLAHRYSFTNAGWDSIGMAHGSIQGTAMATNHVLTLNGVSGGYMDLPGGLISGSAAATIEFWAAFGTNGTPCEILDFGNMTNASGLDYLYFSPHTTAGTHRLQLATNTTAAMDVPGNYDNLTLHFVCLIDPSNHYTAIYTNGMPESSSTIVFPPLGSIGNSWSFIGRSLFSSEAWLNAAIQEVRIYDGRLTPQEIAVNDRYGPTVLALPVSLSVSNAQSGLKFSWPSWAEGFALQYTTNIATGVWQPVTPPAALGSNQWAQSLPQPVATTFYRLKR